VTAKHLAAHIEGEIGQPRLAGHSLELAVGIHLDSSRRRTTIREKSTELEGIGARAGEVRLAELFELIAAGRLTGPDMAGYGDGGVLVVAEPNPASRPAPLSLPCGPCKLLCHSRRPASSRCHCST